MKNCQAHASFVRAEKSLFYPRVTSQTDFRSPDLGGSFLDKLLTIVATPIPTEKKTKTIQLQKEKDTKNTVKFAEVQTQGEAPIIGTLYVRKWFAGDATNLKVTVEAQRAIPGAGRSVQFSDAL